MACVLPQRATGWVGGARTFWSKARRPVVAVRAVCCENATAKGTRRRGSAPPRSLPLLLSSRCPPGIAGRAIRCDKQRKGQQDVNSIAIFGRPPAVGRRRQEIAAAIHWESGTAVALHVDL